MVVDELSTGRLYDAPAVRGGVVGLAFAEGDTLSHLGDCEICGQRIYPFVFPRAIPRYTTTHPSTKDPFHIHLVFFGTFSMRQNSVNNSHNLKPVWFVNMLESYGG